MQLEQCRCSSSTQCLGCGDLRACRLQTLRVLELLPARGSISSRAALAMSGRLYPLGSDGTQREPMHQHSAWMATEGAWSGCAQSTSRRA